MSCVYGTFIAVFGIGLAVDAVIDPDDYGDLGVWWSPLAAIATAVGVAAVVRAVPALWRTARSGDGVRHATKRFAVAWLAVLPPGLLMVWPGVAQVLYTALAIPVIMGLLVLSRAAAALRR